MSISIVRAALETRLSNWAAAQAPPLPIAFQSVSFSKPDDGSPYLECFLLPNITINRQVSGKQKTLYGLFQVNVRTSGGSGMGQPEQIAESIVKLFPLLAVINGVNVEATPYVNRPLSDPDGYDITPVLIKYRYESSV